jgi:signal transduction histidine kinase
LVLCHAGEFNQVILNLLINAAQAIAQALEGGSQGKGKIVVSTTCDQDWAEISISDTGAGIPEAVRSRVFEPFFTTKPVGKGTGQGLALAHTAIVRRHGGKIWFDSELGKGTTFYIRMPLAPPTKT